MGRGQILGRDGQGNLGLQAGGGSMIDIHGAVYLAHHGDAFPDAEALIELAPPEAHV